MLATSAVWLDVACNEAFLHGLDVCGKQAWALLAGSSVEVYPFMETRWVWVAVGKQLQVTVSLAGFEFFNLVG